MTSGTAELAAARSVCTEESGVTDPSRLPIVYKGAWDSHRPQE